MYYVYILTNKNLSTFYTGITSNLIKRTYEHKESFVPGFTKKYNVKKLVYYETYTDVRNALDREKQLKKWHRDWKIRIISKFNPSWKDLQSQLGVYIKHSK